MLCRLLSGLFSLSPRLSLHLFSVVISDTLFSPPPLTSCHLPLFIRQLCSVKETPQHTEEEVGAFTKLIEAMGFTGPLKYNKWVSDLHNMEEKYEGWWRERLS